MTTILGGLALLAASKKSSSSSSAGLLILLLVIGVALYFLFLRPQQQKARRQRESNKEIEVGDEVVTVGGLVGHVVEMTDDRVTVETGGPGGTRMVFVRNAISRKVSTEDAASTETGNPAGQRKSKSPGDTSGDGSGATVEGGKPGIGEGNSAGDADGADPVGPGNGAVRGGDVTDQEQAGEAADPGATKGNGSTGRRRRGRNGTRRTS